MNAFGELLRQMRTERGMTLEELGATCWSEFKRAYMSSIELGNYMPPRATVQELADAMGLKGKPREDFIEVARAEAFERVNERYEKEWGNG